MRRAIACAITLLLLVTTKSEPQLTSTAQPLSLTHVTVIDVTGGPPKQDYTVVITGDRITEMGESAKVIVPVVSTVVDARGKFLIPGLWDMHVHLADKELLPLFIANGVTGVRVMWGKPEYHAWRKDIEAGRFVGPRLVIASPIIDGPRPYWDGSVSVGNEAQARQAVIKAKQDGADFIKIYQFLPRELYFAIADETKKQGISFEGHVPISVSALEAANAGQRSFEHLVGVLPACSSRGEELLKAQQADLADGIAAGKVKFWGPRAKQLRQVMLETYNPDTAASFFSVLKNNGTWQCPTLTLLHMFGYANEPALANDPRLKYMPRVLSAFWSQTVESGYEKRTSQDFAHLRKEFQKDLEVVAAMQKAGVGLLAGTDTPNAYCLPGFGIHDELGFLVQAGLSPIEALQTATLNPARFFGKEDAMGTIEKGKIADLVLLDANPIDDIANTKRIEAVIARGKLFPRATLDQMLGNIEQFANKTNIETAVLIWLIRNVDEDKFYGTYIPVGLGLVVLGFVYAALTLVAIATKTNTAHPWWGWIPVLNVVLMIGIARKPWWWIFLLLIPVVNLVIVVVVWMRIAEARRKPGWCGVFAIVPVLNIILPGYLAWSN